VRKYDEEVDIASLAISFELSKTFIRGKQWTQKVTVSAHICNTKALPFSVLKQR